MKKTILLFLLLATALGSFAQDIFIGSTKDNLSNFYIMSIKHNKKTKTSEIFERIRPADGKLPEFRKQTIAVRQQDKLSTEGFDKLGYYRRRIQYNCTYKVYRLREVTYYDLYGKEIKINDPDPAEDAKWEKIPPATMRDVEFNKACQ